MAKNIKPEETYPDQRIAEIDALLAKRTSEEELAQQQRAVDERYAQIIAIADREFKGKNYDQAKSQYQNALAVKANEQYPKDQLALIEQLMLEVAQTAVVAKGQAAQAPAKMPVAKPTDDGYQGLIVAADNSFDQQDYQVARFYYQKANLSRPSETYPKQRLSEIDELINKTMGKYELAEYENAIKQADKSFAEKQYTIAKFYYYKALGFKSWEQYPKDQILEILRLTNSLLSDLKEKEYQDLIALADEAFVRREYAVARAYYNRSLSIKIDEEYPKIKLDEIRKVIQQELAGAGSKAYLDMIAEGDKAMTANNYSIARFYYQKAIGLNPSENYPKEQFKLIS
jgi:hypothetical protein